MSSEQHAQEPDREQNPARPFTFERGRGVYRVDALHGIAHVVVGVGEDDGRTGRIQQVLRALADERIPIFLIKLHRDALSFAVEDRHVESARQCLHGAAHECRTLPDLSLLTVVAASMRDLSGVMALIADSLQGAGARLYGVGDSHDTVQCLVETARAEAAARELRRTFGLETRT
jgi:aspartokinase